MRRGLKSCELYTEKRLLDVLFYIFHMSKTVSLAAPRNLDSQLSCVDGHWSVQYSRDLRSLISSGVVRNLHSRDNNPIDSDTDFLSDVDTLYPSCHLSRPGLSRTEALLQHGIITILRT